MPDPLEITLIQKAMLNQDAPSSDAPSPDALTDLESIVRALDFAKLHQGEIGIRQPFDNGFFDARWSPNHWSTSAEVGPFSGSYTNVYGAPRQWNIKANLPLNLSVGGGNFGPGGQQFGFNGRFGWK